MQHDDSLFLPVEFLEKLRGDEWQMASGGFDSVLTEEAEESAVRALVAFQAGKERSEWGASASAILCGAAACEYRVSEYLAHWEFASGELTRALEAIRRTSDALVQWRTLLRNVAPTYDLSQSREYQRLGCLVRLRDVVAHRNARWRDLGAVPEQISDCVRQHGIPIRQQLAREWPATILVHEVAAWAVTTSRDWLSVADELVPFTC